MIFSSAVSPFDLALLAPIAALIPPRIQEPTAAMQTDFARRLAGAGFYGPFRLRDEGAVIEDRAGLPVIHVLPVVEPDFARDAAEIACIALNRLWAAGAVEAPAGRPADAAE